MVTKNTSIIIAMTTRDRAVSQPCLRGTWDKHTHPHLHRQTQNQHACLHTCTEGCTHQGVHLAGSDSYCVIFGPGWYTGILGPFPPGRPRAGAFQNTTFREWDFLQQEPFLVLFKMLQFRNIKLVLISILLINSDFVVTSLALLGSISK